MPVRTAWLRGTPLRTILIFIFVFLCLPLGAAARGSNVNQSYALIYGTVWGPDNRPLYGVSIEIRRITGKKAHWQRLSDHSGEFALRVPAGKADYAVIPDLKGYKYVDGKHLRLPQPVTVHIENDERSDIGLHLME